MSSRGPYRRHAAQFKLQLCQEIRGGSIGRRDAPIKAQGYAGGYSRVTDFVRAWRHGEGQSISTTAFVPLAFELGEEFQVDWSEEGLVVGGICYRMQVSHLRLAGHGPLPCH